MGRDVPHLGRRAYDDHTNATRHLHFRSHSRHRRRYCSGQPHSRTTPTIFLPAFRRTPARRTSSITNRRSALSSRIRSRSTPAFHHARPSLRLGEFPGHTTPRFLAARLLRLDPRSKLPDLLRGGGGVYYDRFGGSPSSTSCVQNARRRSVILSLDPATLPTSGCVPITNCVAVTAQPPALAQLMPNAKIPYQSTTAFPSSVSWARTPPAP